MTLTSSSTDAAADPELAEVELLREEAVEPLVRQLVRPPRAALADALVGQPPTRRAADRRALGGVPRQRLEEVVVAGVGGDVVAKQVDLLLPRAAQRILLPLDPAGVLACRPRHLSSCCTR